jgi:type IX secretion system PorP/SprF family membrane protein
MRFKRTDYGYWGTGVMLCSDRSGDSKMDIMQGNLNLAYHLKIAKGQTLGLGLMGGFGQRSVGINAMQWGNQYDGMNFDPTLPSKEGNAGSFTNSFLDLGTGLVYTFNREARSMTANDRIHAIVGLAVFHPHRPDYSFLENGEDRLHRKYVFHGSSVIGIPNSRLSVIPGFMYKIQGTAQELVMGSQLRYQLTEGSQITGFVPSMELYFGAYYRFRDALILTSLLQYGGFGVGLSYDVTASNLARANNGRGALELSLSFKLPQSDLWKRSNARFY